MTNFLDNLVRKAVGEPQLMTPEPPSRSRFETSSDSLFAVEEKPQDNTIASFPDIHGEEFEKPVKIIEDTIHQSLQPERSKSSEPFSISSTGSPESLKIVQPEIQKKEFFKMNDLMLTPPVPPSRGEDPSQPLPGGESPPASPPRQEYQRAEAQIPPLKESPVEEPVLSHVILSEVKGLSKGGKEGVKGGSDSEPDEKSIPHKSRAQVQQEPVKRVPNVEKESRVVKQPIELSPPQERTTEKIKASNEAIVAIEPLPEPPEQVQIKELLTRTQSAVPSQSSSPGEAKTAQASQEKKDVRVNIGRIEIKASQQVSPSSNPPVRGFDEYIMMRTYLDRHYF